MNDNITVTIESEDEDVPEPSFLRNVVQLVCKKMGFPRAEINIQVVDCETIKNLNLQYRNKNSSTNVLSFSSDLPSWIESNLIGDVVLCPSVIRIEANQYNKPLNARWAHMLVHGSLHLLGMSHDNELQQNEMEKRELELMTELGFDDPYVGNA